MKLSDTVNVYPVELDVYESVEGQELSLSYEGSGVSLDKTTAAELLPILQHFIATGELPE